MRRIDSFCTSDSVVCSRDWGKMVYIELVRNMYNPIPKPPACQLTDIFGLDYGGKMSE